MKDLVNFLFGGNKQAVTFLVCVLIAASIWTINALNEVHQVKLKIPVVYLNAGHKKSLEELTKEVEIDLRGRGFSLMRIDNSAANLKIEVDLLQVRNSDSLIDPLGILEEKAGRLDKEIEILRVSPAVISVSGKQKVYSRKVPVKADVKISINPSFARSGPWVVYPDSVNIISPVPIPDSIKSISTLHREYKGLDAAYFGSLPLYEPGSSFQVFPERVWIYIPVEEGTELVLKIPVENSSSNGNYLLIPSRVDLSCQVPLSKFRATRPDLFRVIADTVTDLQGRCLVKIVRAPYWADRISIQPPTITRLKESR